MCSTGDVCQPVTAEAQSHDLQDTDPSDAEMATRRQGWERGSGESTSSSCPAGGRDTPQHGTQRTESGYLKLQ